MPTQDDTAIETAWGDMPDLPEFDPENPPDIKTLSLRLTHFDAADGTHVYSNGCYAFSWSESDLHDNWLMVWSRNASGLFKLEVDCDKTVPMLGKPHTIRIVIPRPIWHEADLLNDPYATGRLIAMKTLVDLNGIVMEKYGLRVISDKIAEKFRQKLSEL